MIKFTAGQEWAKSLIQLWSLSPNTGHPKWSYTWMLNTVWSFRLFEKCVHVVNVSDICFTLTVWLFTLYSMVFRNTIFFYQNWFNTSPTFCALLYLVPSNAVFSLTHCEKFIILTHKDHKCFMLFINDFSWMKSLILSWPYFLGSSTKYWGSWSWKACLSDSCYQRNWWVLFPATSLKFWNIMLVA